MNDKFNWIIEDSNKNLWNFYLNEKKELIYSIKQHEYTWKSQEKIDENVDEFAVNIDYEKKIHIIYIKNKKLKYCIMQGQKKIINTLNDFSSSNYEIRELKLILINNFVHIFCVLDFKGLKEKIVIMNYIWDRKKVTKSPICEIKKNINITKHYEVEIINERDIFLFFINREEDKNILNVCKLINTKWNEPKKIYEFDYNIISYSVTDNKKHFNLINLYSLDSEYKMVDVELSYEFNILKEKVYKSDEKIINPIILMEDDKSWLFWVENDELMLSALDETNISPKEVSNINGLVLYNYILNHKENLKGKRIFGIDPPDKLFLPSDIYEFDSLNKEFSEKQMDDSIKEIVVLQNELKEIKFLEDEIKIEAENIKKQAQSDKTHIEKLSEKLKILMRKNTEIDYKSNKLRIDAAAKTQIEKEQLTNKIKFLVGENKRLKLELELEKENRENEVKLLKEEIEKEVSLLRKEIEKEHIYNEEISNNKGFFERIFKS